MISFKEFLVENRKFKRDSSRKEIDKTLKIEDLPLYHGHEGVGISSIMLDALHEKIQGKENGSVVVPHYNSGGVPVIFGYHDNGKFFVSHKNTPHILNFSPKDVKDNHGDTHTADVIKTALIHLPKIAPPKGAFGGRLFKSKTPKIINESKERSSKLAVAVTESYNGDKGNYSPIVDYSAFGSHKDVNHLTSPTNIQNINYKNQRDYENIMDHAKLVYSKMHYSYPDLIVGHEKHLENFVSKKTNPKVEDYVSYISKKVDPMKINDVNSNKDHFQDLLNLHSHMKKAVKHIKSNIVHKPVSEHNSPKPSDYLAITPKNKTKHIALLSDKTK